MQLLHAGGDACVKPAYSSKEVIPLPSQETAAWLAGLLEGEGSFGFYSPRLVLALSMTDEDIVRRAASLVGAPVHRLKPEAPHHKPPYSMLLRGGRAAYYLTELLPLFGARRSKTISEALAQFDARTFARIQQGKVRAAEAAHYSDEALLERWAARAANQSMRAFCKELGVPGLRNNIIERLRRLGALPCESVRPASRLGLLGFDELTPAGKLAWTAGLLEGEGHFRSAGLTPRVALQMTDEDVVRRFASQFGVSVSRSLPRKTAWKPTFRCEVIGNRAERLMRDILPWMGIRRGARIRQILTVREAATVRVTVLPDGCVRRHFASNQSEVCSRVSDEALIELWSSRAKETSLRALSRKLGTHQQNLKNQLVRLGVYARPPAG